MCCDSTQVKSYNSISSFIDNLINSIENKSNNIAVVASLDNIVPILQYMYEENLLSIDYVGVYNTVWTEVPVCITLDNRFSASIDIVKDLLGEFVEDNFDELFVYDEPKTCDYMQFLNNNNSLYELFVID